MKVDKRRNVLPGGLFTVSLDEDLTIVNANEYFYQLFGYTKKEAEKEGFKSLRQRIPRDKQGYLKALVLKNIQKRKEYIDIEFQGLHKSNGFLWLLVRGSYNETTREIEGVMLDITSRKRKEELEKNEELDRTKEELKKEYYRDSLTGLLNRKGIIESFDSLLEKHKEGCHGFIMLDIDDFKSHNDRCGHLFGDEILEQVSKSLLGLFRSEDIIGRIGGDEFVVILANIPGEETLIKKAQTVNNKIEQILGNGSNLSLSQGIAMYPKDASTFMELYEKADLALYEAKAKGKNQYRIYLKNHSNNYLGYENSPLGEKTLVINNMERVLKQKSFWNADMSKEKMFLFIKTFMENAPGGIGIYQKKNDKFETIYVNKGLLEILELSQDEYDSHYKEDGFKIISQDSINIWLNTVVEVTEEHRKELKGNTYKLSEKLNNSPKFVFAKMAQMVNDEGQKVLLVLSADVSSEIQFMEELRETKEMHRWGLEKAGIAFWEYNINDGSFVNNQGQVFKGLSDMVKANKIHEDSLIEVDRLKEELESGKDAGEIFIKGWGPDNAFEWLKISFRRFRTSSMLKETMRVFVIAEVIKGETRSKVPYVREEWLKNELMSRGIRVFISNLTSNKVEDIKSQGGSYKLDISENEIESYEDLLHNISQNFLKQSKSKEFKTLFSKEVIVENFNKGKDSLKETIQVMDQQGGLNWLTVYTRVLMHPSTGDYYAYTYIKQDNEGGMRENASIAPLARDSVTGLYKESTLAIIANKALKQKMKTKSYGIIVLNMFNYHYQEPLMGGKSLSQIMFRMAEDFQLLLPSRYVCGIRGKNEFIFFLEEDKDVSIKEVSQKFLEKIKSIFRVLDPSGRLIFYAGSASWNEGENYSELYEKAFTASKYASQGENWSYSFYGNEKEELKIGGAILDEIVEFVVKDTDILNGEEVSPEEDREFIESSVKCALNFIEKQDPEVAILNACKGIADYYSAEGVFLAEYKENAPKEMYLAQWAKGQECFSREQGASDDIFNLSTFKEAFKRKEGFITDNLMAIPFVIDDVFGGFFGVIKPNNHKGDLRLIDMASYLLGSEFYRLRLKEGKEYQLTYDPITGFYNRSEYIKMIKQIQNEGLSSLGILNIELNEVKYRNTLEGIRVFDKNAQNLAETIQSFSKECNTYRVNDYEFLSICREASLEYFMDNSRELEGKLKSKFPEMASIGYCWSGEDLDIDRLLQHAEELKEIDQLKNQGKIFKSSGKAREQANKKLKKDVKDKSFTVFIQPIIDVKTGKAYGGEALIRKIGIDGELELPVEFIRNYESLNLIRHIDLFVLEEVCKTIQGWTDQGIPLVPISVNFSKQTLLEADIISKLINISEKHNVPRKLITIEVTERLGDSEESTITEISKGIKESGFGLSLDDFGTEYSNLSIVSKLEIDSLKIDRSLINQIHENKITGTIIRNVLRLCQELNIKSVAEGVESRAQIETLKSWGCDYFQGFYYSKALPVDDFCDKYLLYKD